MAIKKELIDELIASSEGSLIGPNGLVKEVTKARRFSTPPPESFCITLPLKSATWMME